MSHYYDFDPNLLSNRKLVNYRYLDQNLSFYTDIGVFSKDRVDFGTHLLLTNLEIDSKIKNLRILDLGSGYGVVGIALGKVFPRAEVHLVDVNERALELSELNSKLNNLENLKIYYSDAYQNVKDRFDYIITNPPIRAGKEIVHKMVLGSFEHLKVNGVIYIVIQKKQGAPSLIKAIEELGKEHEIVHKKNGYYIFKAYNKR